MIRFKSNRIGKRSMTAGGRAAFLVCWLTLLGCGSSSAQIMSVRDILQLPVPVADHRIAYGSDALQFGDLRIPDGPGPHPVVIFIHGGCWLASYNLDHTASLNAALAQAGIASWSLEYRRVGDAGGGWSGTFEDVAAGADFLRELAPKYSLDLDRVVAMGHSAGGHLALWLAARSKIAAGSALYTSHPLALRGVISLAGVPDLARALGEGTCGGVIKDLMAGSPEQVPEHYRAGSPSELLPLAVPQHLIHGSLDPIVPPDSVRAYAAAARAAGDDVELAMLEGAGHFELISPRSKEWETVLTAVKAFLKK